MERTRSVYQKIVSAFTAGVLTFSILPTTSLANSENSQPTNAEIAPVQQTTTYQPISPAAQAAYSKAVANDEVGVQGPRKTAVVWALRYGGDLLGSMVSNLSKKNGDLLKKTLK